MAEVEVFMQKRYRCPGCRKSWASSTRARRHVESGCVKDVESRSCRTCEHYDPGAVGGWEEPGHDPYCEVGAEGFKPHPAEMPRQCPQWRKERWRP